MTAIWGVWRRDGNPQGALDIEQMSAPMKRYGSDHSAIWVNRRGCVGLGSASAWSLPEDTFDRQPLNSPGSTVLVADLRLDNRGELCQDLSLTAAASGLADVDVLQAAWSRWGEDCVDRLVGEFAFAVWDRRGRRMICVRDPLGRRALHYTVKGPLFAFATFPKGLHALPGIPRRLDETMLATRLALVPETGGRSFFEGIQRVPPGRILTVTNSDVTIRRYWSPGQGRTLKFRRDEEYVDAFRDVLDQSVRARLRSRGPVATMLSGGLDSTTITAVVARLMAETGREVLAFTGVPSALFDGSAPSRRNTNEGPLAATLAAMYPNVRHTLVPPVDACPLDLLGRQRVWSETPGSHICMLPNADAMAQQHRAYGVTTVLTGLGGNMTISYDGMPTLAAWIRHGRWLRWQSEARALHGGAEAHGWKRLLKLSFGPYLPNRPAGVSTHSMLNPGLLVSGSARHLSPEANWNYDGRPWSDGVKMRAANLLRIDTGGASSVGMSVSGVDFRDPTTDRRLIDFCLRVPDEQYLHRGETRWLLRRAMQNQLPPAILNAKAKGLVGADWFLRVAPYRERFAEVVARLEQSPAARNCLDMKRMRRCIDSWPETGWHTPAVESEYRMAFCRGIQMGEFIRWVEAGG